LDISPTTQAGTAHEVGYREISEQSRIAYGASLFFSQANFIPERSFFNVWQFFEKLGHDRLLSLTASCFQRCNQRANFFDSFSRNASSVYRRHFASWPTDRSRTK
jgi:hypothetical protein